MWPPVSFWFLLYLFICLSSQAFVSNKSSRYGLSVYRSPSIRCRVTLFLHFRYLLFPCASGYLVLYWRASEIQADGVLVHRTVLGTSCLWIFRFLCQRHPGVYLMHINVVLIRSVLWILICIVNAQTNAVNNVRNFIESHRWKGEIEYIYGNWVTHFP